MRGHNDFESVAAHQQFIEVSVDKLNKRSAKKFVEEKKYLQPLPKYRACDYEVLTARVSRYSTIEVRCVLRVIGFLCKRFLLKRKSVLETG